MMQILCGNCSNMQLHGRQSTSVGTDKIHAKTELIVDKNDFGYGGKPLGITPLTQV
ncbi:MAG: hypothetical protein ABJN75_23195 [Hoeflea sp.]|uniref:hypothetical protein n=1 Tax=Hoeflea sp. TaxID=1940281 RepID=UPI00329A4E90